MLSLLTYWKILYEKEAYPNTVPIGESDQTSIQLILVYDIIKMKITMDSQVEISNMLSWQLITTSATSL